MFKNKKPNLDENSRKLSPRDTWWGHSAWLCCFHFCQVSCLLPIQGGREAHPTPQPLTGKPHNRTTHVVSPWTQTHAKNTNDPGLPSLIYLLCGLRQVPTPLSRSFCIHTQDRCSQCFLKCFPAITSFFLQRLQNRREGRVLGSPLGQPNS